LVQSKKRVKVRGKIGNMPKEFVLDVSDLDRDDAILTPARYGKLQKIVV